MLIKRIEKDLEFNGYNVHVEEGDINIKFKVYEFEIPVGKPPATYITEVAIDKLQDIKNSV